MRIAFVHYAAAPVIGGVERVMEQQARLLREQGHAVRVLCGNADAAVPGVEVVVVPELRANAGLDEAGLVALRGSLRGALAGQERVLVHNVFTMPFNWAASRVLAELSREGVGGRWVNWVHDVDVTAEAFAGLDLRATHVAVSEVRRELFCERLGVAAGECRVIPNGVDTLGTLGLTREVEAFARRAGLLEQDLVLLHPTRVLARKNIELGLEVTAVLRRQGVAVAYVVTGAPDPHRKESALYAARLGERVRILGVEGCVHFVSTHFPVTNEDVASLYRVADALFFPSRSEGFGLPLVEAVLHRLPVFCSDIPPHREVAGAFGQFFTLEAPFEEVARLVLEGVRSDAGAVARKATMRRFDWQHIFKECLEALIKER